MQSYIITEKTIYGFELYLKENEKSYLTIKKYVSEIARLMKYLSREPISKLRLLDYRNELLNNKNAKTVNTEFSAINAYLRYAKVKNCTIKSLKVQRKAFVDEDRNLSENEYRRLLVAAQKQGNNRLYHIMLTICATGIRVSELRFITMEAVKKSRAEIRLKGKSRTVIFNKKLRDKLKSYAASRGIHSGMIFITRNNRPIDRSNLCHEMKKLCIEAKVNPKKVFPHNLRHLFAKCYYSIEKNLAHLADILGHSSVETTRIYVSVGIREHERILRRMNLII